VNVAQVSAGHRICIVCVRSLPRRPTAIAFTKCGNFVVIGDKAGDVHCFPVSLNSELSEPQTVNSSLLLGHVSMLLDVVGAFCQILRCPCFTSQFQCLGCHFFLKLR